MKLIELKRCGGLQYDDVCVSEDAGLDRGSGASLGLAWAHLTDTSPNLLLFGQTTQHLNKLDTKECDKM